jgi:hypothetical protein
VQIPENEIQHGMVVLFEGINEFADLRLVPLLETNIIT